VAIDQSLSPRFHTLRHLNNRAKDKKEIPLKNVKPLKLLGKFENTVTQYCPHSNPIKTATDPTANKQLYNTTSPMETTESILNRRNPAGSSIRTNTINVTSSSFPDDNNSLHLNTCPSTIALNPSPRIEKYPAKNTCSAVETVNRIERSLHWTSLLMAIEVILSPHRLHPNRGIL
jgi:hypothetical protein